MLFILNDTLYNTTLYIRYLLLALYYVRLNYKRKSFSSLSTLVLVLCTCCIDVKHQWCEVSAPSLLRAKSLVECLWSESCLSLGRL